MPLNATYGTSMLRYYILKTYKNVIVALQKSVPFKCDKLKTLLFSLKDNTI